ncbi:MAG TPA: glycosyltransferase family 9 protein [Candidatus Nanopelagicales bacterium]
MPHAAGHDRPLLLAVRPLKLGDLLVAVPALRALRAAFPEHRIAYAAAGWLAPVVELIGGIDLLDTPHGLDVPLPVPPSGIDVAVNLHGHGGQSLPRVQELAARRVLSHAGGGASAGPPWRDDLHERERWARMLHWFGIAADPLDLHLPVPAAAGPAPGAAVVHVGAAHGSRAWPVARFAAVARALSRAGHRVVMTGGGSDVPRGLAAVAAAQLPDAAMLAGRLGLAQFAATIAHAALVVTADTGAAHLASAYRRPSVVLFGPAPIEQWGPPPGPHLALTDALLRRGEVFATDPDPALLAVTTEDVLTAVDQVLDAHGAAGDDQPMRSRRSVHAGGTADIDAAAAVTVGYQPPGAEPDPAARALTAAARPRRRRTAPRRRRAG